jgi:branched-subunit amino acid transport protein
MINDWFTIFAIGIGTFLIRFLPVFSGRFFKKYPHLLDGMQTLPALIFAALIAPSFFHFQNMIGKPVDSPMLLAGVCTVVAVKIRPSVLLATSIGLGSYLLFLKIDSFI